MVVLLVFLLLSESLHLQSRNDVAITKKKYLNFLYYFYVNFHIYIFFYIFANDFGEIKFFLTDVYVDCIVTAKKSLLYSFGKLFRS